MPACCANIAIVFASERQRLEMYVSEDGSVKLFCKASQESCPGRHHKEEL